MISTKTIIGVQSYSYMYILQAEIWTDSYIHVIQHRWTNLLLWTIIFNTWTVPASDSVDLFPPSSFFQLAFVDLGVANRATHGMNFGWFSKNPMCVWPDLAVQMWVWFSFREASITFPQELTLHPTITVQMQVSVVGALWMGALEMKRRLPRDHRHKSQNPRVGRVISLSIFNSIITRYRMEGYRKRMK